MLIEIDAGLRDIRDVLNRYAPARFGEHAAVDERNRFPQQCGRHVVEQHRVDRFFQRFLQLRDRIDFDLDLHHVSGSRACRGDGVVDGSGHGEMIVFDQQASSNQSDDSIPPPQRTA